jgi:glycosyltransferase involved in cell wall biosynthesis
VTEVRKKLSVIVPVYYNAESLPLLEEQLVWMEQELAMRGVDVELIFVNDGSGDSSQAELLAIRARRPATKVIKHTKNFGSVAASRTGFRFVTGQAFVVLAADLQDPVETVVEMVDHWLAGNPFVIAVRQTREDPTSAMALSWLYYRLIDRFVLEGYPKTGFDLMLAEKPVLDHILNSTKNVNPNILAYSLGFRPVVVRYHRKARQHGRSRWSLAKRLRHFANTITGFSAAPIRIMSSVGLIVSALSFIYGIYIAVASMFGAIPLRGFTTIVVLISFFSGMILVTLGIIGEYLWRIFEVVNKNVESVIEETLL